MIECKICHTAFLEKNNKVIGRNLHTVIENKTLKISLEYLEEEESKVYELQCKCGKKEWVLLCDDCKKADSELFLVEVSIGYPLVLCKECCKGLAGKKEKITLNSLEIDILLNQQQRGSQRVVTNPGTTPINSGIWIAPSGGFLEEELEGVVRITRNNTVSGGTINETNSR